MKTSQEMPGLKVNYFHNDFQIHSGLIIGSDLMVTIIL
jgi:hypothetical protein